MARNANIIAVASGKGGVGKTWFSVTLSHALAKMGEKVLLFDGDFGLANIDIQLALMAKHDIASVLTNKITLNQTITHYKAGGFDIIPGRSGSGSLAQIPPNRLQLLLEDLHALAPDYDRVIVDLGAGLEKSVRMFAGSSGNLIIVCSDEPSSMTDAYAFIKIMTLTKAPAKIKIVINSANSTREGEKTYNTISKACKEFLKIDPPLLGVIRRDTQVRDAIRNQATIITRSPNAIAAEDVLTIASNITSGL